jgi:glutamine cyclotransferase
MTQCMIPQLSIGRTRGILAEVKKLLLWAVIAAGVVLIALLALRPRFSNATPVYTYRIVHVYPHDPTAFTQGLEYRDGLLYEGTGLNGRSSVRKVKLETGEVLEQKALPYEFFGEGITLWGKQLIELTWQTQVGFVYEASDFQVLRNFRYSGEGWGLTHDSTRLIMSDGTPALRFWKPDTLEETGRVTVTDLGQPVANLNELEYVRGEVYANIWQTDRIARIAPATGRVLGWIDLAGLRAEADVSTEKALNGIAYDAKTDRLFVTGKEWPKLFEIKVVAAK